MPRKLEAKWVVGVHLGCLHCRAFSKDRRKKANGT